MSKQQMIISILESVILDPAVLVELKQYRLDDEDSVQKFILAIKRALRQEIRRTFNDWGYADNLGMSMLVTSGLVLIIDSGFSINTLNEIIQNSIRITGFLMTGSSVWLHHARRQFIQEYITIVSEILLHFYSSPTMMLWRQCQAQQDIVQCLEEWKFDDKMVTRLRTNRVALTGKPQQNSVKKENFLKHVLTIRSQFQAHMRLTAEGTFHLSFFSGVFLVLSGSALLDQVTRHGASCESILILGGVAFYYYHVHQQYMKETLRSHALAEWDIQAIDHWLAVLSGNTRQKETKLSRSLPSAVDKASEVRSSIHPLAHHWAKKKPLPKTRTCTTRLKQVISQLGHAMASTPAWGYQFMASLLQSVSIRAPRQLSVEEAFQEIIAVGDQPVQKPPKMTRRKFSKTQPCKKIKRSVQTTPRPPQSFSVQEHNLEKSKIIPPSSDELLSENAQAPVFELESALPKLDEKLSVSAPSMSTFTVKQQDSAPEESKLLHPISCQPLPEKAAVTVSVPKSVLPDGQKLSATIFHQPHTKAESPHLVFSSEEEKALLLKRAQLAEQAFRIQQGRALSAEEYIRYLQGQLARVTYTAHYWQWHATSLWNRVFSAPHYDIDSSLPNTHPSSPTSQGVAFF